MIARTRIGLSILGLALFAGACQDLDVTNPNNPDRERALDNPEDVESLIASSWRPYWRRTQAQGWPYHAMNSISGVMVTSVANNCAMSLSDIPRSMYNNTPASECAGLARFPWYDVYSGLDSSNEGLRALNDGMQFGVDGADNERARAWAKFSQGLLLGYLGLMYDQAIVAKEDADFEDPSSIEFRPYPEVIAAAVESLEEAASIARANSFDIPGEWMRLVGGLSSDRLARIAHSFAARFLVLTARTPQERAELNWNEVLRHLDQGIAGDLVIDHNRDELESSNYKRRIQANFFNGFFMANRFIGKADVSGNYQAWLATPLHERQRFHITTPDRRITGETPTSNGKYMIYRARNSFRDERGTWRQSYYQLRRWDGEWRDAPLLIMSTDEMELYRAEAFYHQGDRAGAAEIINRTRVANGELPPVTAAGVEEAEDCVPRTDQGACEDLLGALMYERILETTGFESTRDWMEARGFGHLLSGTFLHLPVPGRELETLNLPIYTFGGEGGTGAAP